MNEIHYPRPHDLLWHTGVQGLTALPAQSSLPAWLNPNWPVVVRRAPMSEDGLSLPVGLRGMTRSVRCPAMLSHAAIKRCLTPESLTEPDLWLLHPLISDFPAIGTLMNLIQTLSSTDLVWGPVGSVGFALATGTAVLRTDSDLDLVVRSDEPLKPEQIKLLQQVQHVSECRIDVQIDSGRGGFSLAEWVRGAGRVLLKTNFGPILTNNPWSDQFQPDAKKKSA